MRLWPLSSWLFLAGILLISCPQRVSAETYESTSKAIACFSQQQFNDGQSILTQRLRDSDLGPDEHAAILNTLGDFYCDYAGDFSKGVEFYQQAVELTANTDSAKNSRLDSILAAQVTYAEIDAIIQEIMNRENWQANAPDTPAKINTLQQFIRQTPDYYRIAEAHYCLALFHAAENRDLKALAELKRAQSIKPAISLFIPLQRHVDFLQARLNREIALHGSTLLFGISLIVSALLFFLAKPWKWLTFNMIGKFAALLAILIGLFIAIGNGFAASYRSSAAVQQQFSVGEYYLFTALLSPGFHLYLPLLLYMSTAFLTTYLFALGTSVLIRRKLVGAMLNGFAGTLIMASLVCLFYIKHCDAKTSRDPELTPHSFFSTTAGLQFTVKGIEPYLLTDPDAFCDPGVSHNTNPALEEWARQHCPFSQKDATDGQ